MANNKRSVLIVVVSIIVGLCRSYVFCEEDVNDCPSICSSLIKEISKGKNNIEALPHVVSFDGTFATIQCNKAMCGNANCAWALYRLNTKSSECLPFISDFWSNSRVSNLKVSPSGKYVAFISGFHTGGPCGGGTGLNVWRISDQKQMGLGTELKVKPKQTDEVLCYTTTDYQWGVKDQIMYTIDVFSASWETRSLIGSVGFTVSEPLFQ